MEGNTAPSHPSGAEVGRGGKKLLRKTNSEALLFRDFSLKVADVAGGNRDTVWAAGLLTELTWCLNVCQEQETSDIISN